MIDRSALNFPTSKNPINACIKTAMSISTDGKEVIMACVDVSWKTTSIYNTSDVAATYKARAVAAAIQ